MDLGNSKTCHIKRNDDAVLEVCREKHAHQPRLLNLPSTTKPVKPKGFHVSVELKRCEEIGVGDV